ncbi:hypothetical protein CK936_14535 [Streptomyces albireticuli]|uniref:Uncharacterized protein n=1 Tax=Streptomyces albireticuli TaxID=1940 RepID=A0A2A2D9R9_9ACTN|nr:hypothetical protein CK936_14535 [Streptomyces albireticuli]
MELDGLRAGFQFMCPTGHCVDFWSMVLTDDITRQKFKGGEFFVYAPAPGEFSFFLDTDIAVRTVGHPARSAWSTPSSSAPIPASRSAMATPTARTGPAPSPQGPQRWLGASAPEPTDAEWTLPVSQGNGLFDSRPAATSRLEPPL